MKKRLLTITLLIASALFLFSACAGNEGENGTETPPIIDTYTVIYSPENADDVVLTLNVGEQPSAEQIPTLAAREGYDAAWSVSDFSSATKNQTVTVTAVYTPKSYTVRYQANGGVELTQTTTVSYHRQYLLETPVREGFVFVEWQDADGNAIALSGDAWRIAQDVTLTAQWVAETPDTCSVIFLQEGKPSVTRYALAGEGLEESEIPAIEEKEGYTAVWSVRGQPADFSQITASMTVTPKYTPKSYRLSFDTAGGTQVSDVITLTYGEAYDLSAYEPEKAGVYFIDGWYVGERSVPVKGVWNVDCNAEDTLTAKYSVKVTFKQNGVADQVAYYLVGTSVSADMLPALSPKDGYIVKWEKDTLTKLTNLQADVVINAVEQDLSWSPSA